MVKAKGLAVITGASSGIGAEFARVLAARGYDCVVTARRQSRLEELAAELERDHRVKIEVIAADLSTPEGADNLHRDVAALGRPVSFLVNNAGFGVYGDFIEMDSERLLQMMQLNMFSLTTLTHRFAKSMLDNGGGRVLQVASIGAFQPCPLYAVYAATKSYVRDFSQALNWELKGTGVTVSTICPGLTESEFHEVAGHIKPAYMNPVTMSARQVAEIGIRGAEKGRAHVTPGVANKMMGFWVKWMPRSMATDALARLSMLR